MYVPLAVLKSVAFIGHTVGGEDRYEGTGFLVAVPSQVVRRKVFFYLVTAKHVADKVEGNFWVRMNKVGGGAVKVPGGDKVWTRHPTEANVDVAVIEWSFDNMDHLAIGPPMVLGTRDDLDNAGIGVGDEVFLAGVFASAHGEERNTPIVRKGNLAMVPEDKIRTKDLGMIDAYLVEAHSFGGISGAPVHARKSVVIEAVRSPHEPGTELVKVKVVAAGEFFLIGLAHGHWEIDETDVNAVYLRKPTREELGINLGISIVVPAFKIKETLRHPDLVSARKEWEKNAMAQEALPTPDSTRNSGEKPGPEPETLAIDLPMDDAVKKMFEAGKPPKP